MSEDDKEKPSALATLLLRRDVRIGLGAALFILCALMAYAAFFLPLAEIKAGGTTHGLDGRRQSENLNLVLTATGILGAILAAIFAITRLRFRFTFFVVGGVGLFFSGLLMIGVLQTIERGKVVDPKLYEKIRYAAVEMQMGSGIWLPMTASLAVIAIAFLAARSQPPLPPPSAPKRPLR